MNPSGSRSIDWKRNMEDRINLLLTSYSIEDLLEENDITDEAVVEMLINRGLINLEDYFDDD